MWNDIFINTAFVSESSRDRPKLSESDLPVQFQCRNVGGDYPIELQQPETRGTPGRDYTGCRILTALQMRCRKYRKNAERNFRSGKR